LSHDWPASIEHHGDIKDLLRRKPFLRDDIDNKELGSPPSLGLIRTLKPDWWFSAHLHVKYEATFIHESDRPSVSSPVKNPDEIVIEEDADADDNTEKIPDVPGNVNQTPDPLPVNPDEIKLDDEEKEVTQTSPPPSCASNIFGRYNQLPLL
jgi:lariat debranching enzyme